MVTVIMPVYNVQPYIEEAVDSVLKQSFIDFELLVIDDQSPDGSIELIKSRFTDKRMRVITQENRGLAGARNTGIRQAQGTHVAFLDSDDFWHAEKLAKHIELLEREPLNGVTFSASMFVSEQSESLNRVQTPFIKHSYTARNIFCRNPIGNGSAPVIRKSVLEQIAFKGCDKHGEKTSYWQYFDESLKQSEDIDCWTRIALITATGFALIDEPLTYYRVNNAGLSADVNMQYKTWELFISKTSVMAPEFVKMNGSAARAFQCRYIARRCISQGDGRAAFKWMARALKNQPMALMDEKARTFTTIVASVVMAVLPKALQRKMASTLT
jgi:glycosyltransferase involved in cell wall biosynthesis